MFYFATYFDKNYLSRGLVLYDSLKKHCEKFDLYVLCLDNNTFEYFLKYIDYYPEIKALSLKEIEEHDSGLKESKKNRSTIEYYFTLSPCLPLYLLKKYNPPHICSLDADIMFFSSPAIVFSNLKDFSVLITPHNFSPELKSREIYGKYNVSFQIFKNDDNGLKCLERWRRQCIDWCYYRLEDDKFADQKYLDNWVSNLDGVYSIDTMGVGVAPWNISTYSITFNRKQVLINNSKLIYYHFHGLRLIGPNLLLHGLNDYNTKTNRIITRHIYKPYIKKLLSQEFIDNSKIIEATTKPRSALKMILFQENWFYYKSGLLFEKNKFLELLGKIIIKAKNHKRNRMSNLIENKSASNQ